MSMPSREYQELLKDSKERLPALSAWKALDFKAAHPDQIRKLHDAAALETGYVTALFVGYGATIGKYARVTMKEPIAQAYHKAGLASSIEDARDLFDQADEGFQKAWARHDIKSPGY